MEGLSWEWQAVSVEAKPQGQLIHWLKLSNAAVSSEVHWMPGLGLTLLYTEHKLPEADMPLFLLSEAAVG